MARHVEKHFSKEELERIGQELLAKIISCAWGKQIGLVEDEPECTKSATSKVILHDGPAQLSIILCDEHFKLVCDRTDPHKE